MRILSRSVDNSVRIKKDDYKGLTALAQYIIRSPFSLSKLSYHGDSGMVTYRSKMTHGRNKKNFVVMNAEEFIAAITQHIPEKEQDNDIEVIDVSTYKPKRIPSPTWRECIKKIWEVDPLACPKCQAEMKIVSFIIKKKVIRKILVHLRIWDESARQRPPPSSKTMSSDYSLNPNDLFYEPFEDGWPGYDK